MNLSIKNCRIVDKNNNCIPVNIYVENGRIKQIGEYVYSSNTIDAGNKIVLPGLIDPHVHFRDFDYSYKEDFFTGSCAAAAGGTTTVLDMPNTKPGIVTLELLEKKRAIAREKSLVNFGFHFGAGSHNLEELKNVKNVPAVKIYMNFTTGDLLIDNDETLKKIFSSGQTCNRIFCLHAEGATFEHALELNKDYNNRLYLCHASLKKEIDIVRMGKKSGKPYYLEVCIPHLFLTNNDYIEKNGFAKIKPSLSVKKDQDALWDAIQDGTIDVIATDHAPHTIHEKSSENPPFGLPGVQLRLPLLLNEVNRGKITLRKLIELTAENPGEIFGMKNKGKIEVGYDADLVIIDLDKEKIVTSEEQLSKCSWSPYQGWKLKGWPVMTIVQGNIVYTNGNIISTFKGKEVEFGDNVKNMKDKSEKFNLNFFNEFMLKNNTLQIYDNQINLVSGRKTYMYANCRNLLNTVGKIDQLTDFILDFVEDNNIKIDYFFGVPEGATKLGDILNYKMGKRNNNVNQCLVIGRGKPKEHGMVKDKYFIGDAKENDKVIVVEDVTTTGGSLLKTIDKLKEFNIKVVAVIVLFDRMQKTEDGKSVGEKIAEAGVEFLSLTNASLLLPLLLKKNPPIQETYKRLVEEFKQYGVIKLE